MNIELVDWRDACEVEGDLDKQRGKKLPVRQSVGFVTDETDEHIVLVHRLDKRNHDEYETQIDSQGIAIPKTWIVKREVIKEA